MNECIWEDDWYMSANEDLEDLARLEGVLNNTTSRLEEAEVENATLKAHIAALEAKGERQRSIIDGCFETEQEYEDKLDMANDIISSLSDYLNVLRG